LLEVAGRPFVDWIIGEVARHGFDRVLLLGGHLGACLHGHYDGPLSTGAEISVIVEAKPQGTGGALRSARLMLDDTFLVCNGDSLFAFNLLDLLLPAELEDANWLARIALRRVPDMANYGAVTCSGERIAKFNEKMASGPGLINAGVYLMRQQALDLLPATGPASLEADLFPKLATEGRLHGRAYEGYFIDIGTPERLKKARAEVAQQMRRPAAYLDGDALLGDDGSPMQPSIRCLNDRGYYVIGLVDSLEEIRRLPRLNSLREGWRAAGAHVDAFLARVGTREADCQDSLPQIPLDWPLRLEGSFVASARPADIGAAMAMGITGHRLLGIDGRERGNELATLVRSIAGYVDHIRNQSSS
jgi:D-glycero-D-manno-heptose 1,7-bisphosphate phosphatase